MGSLGLAGCGLLVLAGVFWLRRPEPVYQGKRLSEWLPGLANNLPWAQRNEAAQAVRHIGTNAIPLLIDWVSYDPPPWRRRLEAVCYGLPGPLGRVMGGFAVNRTQDFVGNAATAFQVLGPVAASAVPELARRFDAVDSSAAHRAGIALAFMGPDGLAALLSTMTNSRSPNRYVAANCMTLVARANPTNALPAVPVLLLCLKDTNTVLATRAANSLGYMAAQPEIVVPELAACLASPKREVRCAAAKALYSYGDLARPAAAALVKALDDPALEVQEAVATALVKVAPDEWKKFQASGKYSRLRIFQWAD